MHLIKSGERPYVNFFSNEVTGGWIDECSISGKLQQP
jgi:hypothetical protein